MGMIETGAMFLLVTIGSWFGGFFGTYFNKKGENLATHEDLDKLLIQMKATTEATKAIEARISSEVWDRQREWEFKREALLEGGRAIADFLASIMRLNSVIATKKGTPPDDEAAYLLKLSNDETTALDAVNKASYSLQRAQLVMAVVSSKKTQIAFVRLERLFKQIAVKIVDGDTEYFDSVGPKLKEYSSDLTLAIRRELGFDDAEFTSQSSESSPTPNPAR